ncbi:Dynein light chain 2, cytoplasmic [Dimargaris verticillata]|uniref:Dynein light chain n=1 Tax=Dimargaris verticillata TaxID=2761393 RepID=A0A9W8EA04_9FUNG|nr:Dynein light chain 2, cytoplasmic [Dimargaris verticillata]
MADRKVVIKSVDMAEELQNDVLRVTNEALDQCQMEKDIAAFIKRKFDAEHQATWHCIVGKSFGSYVTHETQHFIYFYIDKLAILLFKSG